MFALISSLEFLIYKMTQYKSPYFIFLKNTHIEKVYQVINCTFHPLYKFYSKHFPSSTHLVNYALHLYFSPNIIHMIKSRRIWVGHVERMGREVHTGFWWKNLRERDHLEDMGTGGR